MISYIVHRGHSIQLIKVGDEWAADILVRYKISESETQLRRVCRITPRICTAHARDDAIAAIDGILAADADEVMRELLDAGLVGMEMRT